MARNLTGLVDARQFVQITSPVSRPRLHLPRAGQVRRSDNGPVRPGAAFAAPLGADREERLLLLFAGLLDKFNFLREFALGGVRDFVLRAKILRDAVAQNDAALAAEGGAWVGGAAPGRRSSPLARCAEMDDAMEEAEFLCRRYAYLDRKLRELTAASRAAL
jgi:hypothetical protein